MTSKELRAQRAKLIEDARTLVSGATVSAEDNARFETMMAEADGLKVRIDNIERADTLFAENQEALRQRGQKAGKDPEEISEEDALETETFRVWMRRGQNALTSAQRAVFEKRFQAAQGEGVDSAGGYTVPQDNSMMTAIEDAQKAYGGMLENAYVFTTSGGQPLPIPTDNDTTNSGVIIGENPTSAATQDVTFGSVTFNGYTFSSKLVLVSNQLLQDSAFNLDGFLAGKLGTRIARAVNTYTTTGNGANAPTGVVTAGTLGYTAGGSTSSGSTATIGYDDLIELEHSVDPAYRRNAKFMMSDTALKVVKKLKDGQGRPLWMAGLAVKEPDTINSYPYAINQDMAVPAASAKTVLFGDFSKYFIRKIVGTQMLRLAERYAELNQVGFLAFQRWDGNLVDAGTHPIKYLQQSAT